MLHLRPTRTTVTRLPVLAIAAILVLAPPARAGKPDPAAGVWRVNLVAQTDSRATMHPCHCPGIGGSLALRLGIFKRLRSSHEAFLMVDGGDAVPSDTVFQYRDLAGLMVDAMEMMGYDAAVPGETELALGPEAVAKEAARIPLVCANLSLMSGDSLAIPPVRWLRAGNHTVAVTGYLDPLLYYGLPGLFDHGQPPFLVRDPLEALDPVVEVARKKADLVILLAHATSEQLADILPHLPGIGVVVVGHGPGERTRFESAGGVPVITPGPRSRELAQIRLAVKPDGTVGDDFHRVWDLRQEGTEDAALKAVVDRYRKEHGDP
jgi:2',3'-cyclic-nucleotide 2'-phosphodiesterase (5'-nucleotidase family)